jgi:hypothetical protein
MTAKLTRREALTLLAAGTLASSAFGLPRKPSMHALPIIGLGTWQTFDVGNSAAAHAKLRQVLTEFRHHAG